MENTVETKKYCAVCGMLTDGKIRAIVSTIKDGKMVHEDFDFCSIEHEEKWSDERGVDPLGKKGKIIPDDSEGPKYLRDLLTFK